MENGLRGQLGPVAVLFVEVEQETELEVATIPHHHLVATIVLGLTLKLQLVMMPHVYMVRV